MIITHTTGNGGYEVKPYGHPDGPITKYTGEAIHKLPQVILPCTPLNTLDQQYLNFVSSPAVHPLKKVKKLTTATPHGFPIHIHHLEHKKKQTSHNQFSSYLTRPLSPNLHLPLHHYQQ